VPELLTSDGFWSSILERVSGPFFWARESIRRGASPCRKPPFSVWRGVSPQRPRFAVMQHHGPNPKPQVTAHHRCHSLL
jgi:hypothetical protein